MKRKDRRLRVGITLGLLGLLLFALVFSLDSALAWWRGSETVEVIFPDVQGLRANDPVHFHGVPCGRVRTIQFTGGTTGAAGPAVAYAEGTDTGVAVRLELEVPVEVYRHLRRGTRATIDKTLTGVTVVQLAQGEGEPLPPGEALEGTLSTSIRDVTEALAGAAGRVNGILESIAGLLAAVDRDDLVAGTLDAVRETAAEARSLAADLRRLVDETRPALKRLTGDGACLVEDLARASESLPETLAEIDAAAGTYGDLGGALRDWFRDARDELAVTTEEVASAATNLNSLSTELRHRPWRLLHSPTKEEALELDLFESMEQYARGAIALRRSTEQVRSLLECAEDDPALARRLESALAELSAHVSRQQAFERAFWQRLEGLKE